MIAWMAYAALVGAIVAVAGLAMERLAAAVGRPRRIAWLVALPLAVAIPLTGGWDGSAQPAADSAATPVVIDGAVVVDLRSATPPLPVPQGRATGRIALLGWVAGSLASLAVLGSVLVMVARGRRRWERRRVNGADFYVSRRFGPALVGVARPEVVIPSWVLQLEPGARDAIIRHEAEHARARDHLVLLYGGLLAAAFPWSPAIWWMYRRLRAAVELDCDQRVLASGIGVAEYGDVLLSAGARSRARWGFAPAMGQPESLLERRLKTMSEKGRKPSGGYAALLVAVAAGALVVACDTPVPTEVREAFAEAMAEDEAQGADAEQEDWIERFLGATAFGKNPAPLLYVDGIRVQSEEDLLAMELFLADAGTGELRKLVERIERVEVLKGAAAAKLYGEEGAGGVIQLFTDIGSDVEFIIVPPAREIVVTGQLIDTVIALPSVGLVATGRTDESGQAAIGAITVTGVAGQEPEVDVIEKPVVRQFVMARQGRAADQAMDWDKWFTENVVAKAPPRWKPVIYVDGVRVDGGAAGLNDVLPALDPGSIARIEVGKGEVAAKRYGKEGAHGVIHIFTRKKSSEEPFPEAGKGGKGSSKRSPAGSP